jgi:DNA invertase Pin-like site-specific DNA recombinase
MLRDRVVSGIASARKRGIILGRKKGSVKPDDVMLKQYHKVIKDIQKNIPLRKLMVIHNLSKGTIIKIKKMVNSSKE